MMVISVLWYMVALHTLTVIMRVGYVFSIDAASACRILWKSWPFTSKIWSPTFSPHESASEPLSTLQSQQEVNPINKETQLCTLLAQVAWQTVRSRLLVFYKFDNLEGSLQAGMYVVRLRHPLRSNATMFLSIHGWLCNCQLSITCINLMHGSMHFDL